jgi:hypothetical protein
MYQSSENAYATLDFYGNGVITLEDFMDSTFVKNKLMQKYSKEMILDFLKSENIFPDGVKGINFDSFKKYFFP